MPFESADYHLNLALVFASVWTIRSAQTIIENTIYCCKIYPVVRVLTLRMERMKRLIVWAFVAISLSGCGKHIIYTDPGKSFEEEDRQFAKCISDTSLWSGTLEECLGSGYVRIEMTKEEYQTLLAQPGIDAYKNYSKHLHDKYHDK